MLTVARVGWHGGRVDVDYTIAAGGAKPATAGVDFVAAGPITLNFAAGETVATIPVTINGDDDLEGLETMTVTLTNPTGGATINGSAGTATLTIADDDALINEVLANISNAHGRDRSRVHRADRHARRQPHGLLLRRVRGRRRRRAAQRRHRQRHVADLGDRPDAGQTFGANGLLVITPRLGLPGP